MAKMMSPPKKARTCYNFFLKEMLPVAQAEFLQHMGRKATYTEGSRLVAARWRKLAAYEKKRYTVMALKDKERYGIEMVQWKQQLSQQKASEPAYEEPEPCGAPPRAVPTAQRQCLSIPERDGLGKKDNDMTAVDDQTLYANGLAALMQGMSDPHSAHMLVNFAENMLKLFNEAQALQVCAQNLQQGGYSNMNFGSVENNFEEFVLDEPCDLMHVFDDDDADNNYNDEADYF